jgi:hypothetical protein
MAFKDELERVDGLIRDRAILDWSSAERRSAMLASLVGSQGEWTRSFRSNPRGLFLKRAGECE